MTNIVKTEPAVVAGAVAAVAGSTIALLVAFGAPITDGQTQAILAAIPAYVSLIALLVAFIRSQVTPTAKIEQNATPDDYIPQHAAEEL